MTFDGKFKKGHKTWNKGKKMSKEQREKLRQAKLNNPVRYWQGKKRPDISGANNSNWSGDKVGYSGLHSWLTKHFGQPRFCEGCGTEESTRFEWANTVGTYTRNRENFIRLCKKCHNNFDGVNIQQNIIKC